MAETVAYKIVEHIAMIGDKEKELNLVSWNGRDAKLDLRAWSQDHERAYKGMTLTHQEAKDLHAALGEYLKGKGND